MLRKKKKGCLHQWELGMLLVLLLTALACGAGGKTGPSSVVVFTPAMSSPGDNTVSLQQNSSLSSGDVITVDVKVVNVTDVFGAAFDVDFDPAKVSYVDLSVGNFLEQGGSSPTYLPASGSGKLTIGVSRLYPAGGASGSGTIVTLRFRVTGNSPLVFSGNALKNPSLGIIPASWYGGSVSVQ